MPSPPRLADWLSLFALTLLWGTAFLFNELALASFPPAALVFGRILIASVVLLVFMRACGIRLPAFGPAWAPMLVMAVFGNVLPFYLIAAAQQHIDSSLAGILMAVMPLFVLTLAHFFLPGAKLTLSRAAGFVVGFVGVILIIGPEAVDGLASNAALWSTIAVLGASFSYAANSIYARRLGAKDPVRLSAGLLVVASLLSLPGATTSLSGLQSPTFGAVAALLVLGLMSTGVATILYFRLVQGPGPTFLSLVNYMVPAWAVLFGVLFLGESVSPVAGAGLLLILAGIALSEFGSRVRRMLAVPGRWRIWAVLSRAARENV